jgi:hypothetical protein
MRAFLRLDFDLKSNKQFVMKKRFTLFAAMVLMAGTFTACKDEVVAKKYARLDVINASPDAPGLNAIVDSTIISPYVLQFGSNMGYMQVEAKKSIIKFNTFLSDTTTDSSVLQTEFTFKENEHYSVFLVDSFSKVTVLLTPDQWPETQNGKAFVRFLQLSPNAPVLDVVKMADTVPTIIFGNMAFKDVTAFTPIDAGVYNWSLAFAGKDTVFGKLPTMIFNTGKVYTVYTKGFDSTYTGKKALGATVITNQY